MISDTKVLFRCSLMVLPLQLAMICWPVGWMAVVFGGRNLTLVKSLDESRNERQLD